MKNKAAFLKQHIRVPNPTGAKRQECCDRILAGCERDFPFSLLAPPKSEFLILWGPLLRSLGLAHSQGGQEEDGFLVQVHVQAE